MHESMFAALIWGLRQKFFVLRHKNHGEGWFIVKWNLMHCCTCGKTIHRANS